MQGWTTSALIHPFEGQSGHYDKQWTIQIMCVIYGVNSLSFDVISVVNDAAKEPEQCKVNTSDY